MTNEESIFDHLLTKLTTLDGEECLLNLSSYAIPVISMMRVTEIVVRSEITFPARTAIVIGGNTYNVRETISEIEDAIKNTKQRGEQ